MITTFGSGEFTVGVTASGSAVAPTGTFSDSLTVSGVPVATGVELVTTIVGYIGNATGVFRPDTLNFVTLSGINRVHWMQVLNASNQVTQSQHAMPLGETGDVVFRRLYDNGASQSSQMALDAPLPGVSQVLEIDSFQTTLNFPGIPYRLYIVGTPT